MYIGAASGAVTIGLALFLAIMSQKPDPSQAEQTKPANPAAEKTEPAPPQRQSAVRLPPPPAPPAAPLKAAAPQPELPVLKPRAPRPSAKIARLEPRRPRPPRAAPPPAAPPETAAEPVPQSQPVAAPAEVTEESGQSAIVSRETVTEGRALLRMLEAGRGPVIEIAWPAQPAARSRLYRLLTTCHGMQTALLAGESAIFVEGGTPGEARPVNRDAVSGFVRRPSGVLTDSERSVIRRIRSHHGMSGATPVRLFPRAADAALLGGIGRAVGTGYLRHTTIRARYRLSGDQVAVTDIRADGADRPGGVVLPRTRHCG